MHSVLSYSLLLFPIILGFGGWFQEKHFFSDSQKNSAVKITAILLVLITITLSITYTIEPAYFVGPWFALTPVKLLMLLMVIFMTITLIKFSARYLQTEKNVDRYWRWLLLSLASVSIVILSNHLLLFWLGWVAISLCFHRLLLFYPDRPRAVLAAHKKFILARVAELLLLAAFIILYWSHDTLQISSLFAHYQQLISSGSELGMADKVAAVLIAFTALIKCAQLPVHGWLIQVVEAPTPISALLHAGIINLGGFLLISFAPLISLATGAQWLLLILAGISLFISALVMMTRISVKVRLAWSTCAQMGLMLIECALGLYEIALLHLFTHSLYKAYAFLSSGDALQGYHLAQFSKPKKLGMTSAFITLFIAIISLTIVVLISRDVTPISIWLLVSLSFAMYFTTAIKKLFSKDVLLAVITVSVLLSFYWLGKSLVGYLVPEMPQAMMFSAMDIWIAAVFLSLYFTSIALSMYPNAALTKTLSRWFFSGLYLDESMTRLTLILWPVRLRNNAHRHPARHTQ